MSANLAKNINHYGQLLLLVLASICCILGATPLMVLSMFLMYFLPILGIWQVIDFIALWAKNGYKKWYSFYIGAMLTFVLLVLLGYIFHEDNRVVNFATMLGFGCYNIVIAWIYLLYWRKK